MARLIDAYVDAPWYLDHVLPVWRALPARKRGRLYLGPNAGPAPDAPGVTTDELDDGGPILVVGHMDLMHALRAGRQNVSLGQHGAGQSYGTDHPSYPGGDKQDGVGLFLVPNATAARRTIERYPGSQVAVVGCPKLDDLPRKERRGKPVIAVSFHWDSRDIAPETRSAWRWYRTMVPYLTRRWTVLGHGHPRMMRMLTTWYEKAGIEPVRSFDAVLRRADVYVADNSSTIFEFAATGRPVVLLNAPTYRRGVEHGLRFWEAAGIGVNVDLPRKLLDGVAQAIEDPAEVRVAREAALDVVYQPRRGGAALAARALIEWAAR